MVYPRRILIAVAFLVAGWAAVAFPTSARAGVTLDVSIGWDGLFRGGRWVPVFITASDTLKPRAVRIDVEAPQGGPYVMQLSQYITIGPQPMTVPLYIPLSYNGDNVLTVTLHDDATGKTLARWPQGDEADNRPWEHLIDANKKFVGVTGVESRFTSLETDIATPLLFGYSKPELLPETAVGYDLLDLLLLYPAGPNHIPVTKQQAIVDWVRAGGCLLVVPPDDRLPDGPLTDIFPCKIGQPKNYPFTKTQQASAHLADRITGIMGFELTPKPSAEVINMIADPDGKNDIRGYSHRVGFGRVIVVPLDFSQLRFNEKAPAFVQNLLEPTGLFNNATGATNSYAWGMDAVTSRHQQAVSHLQDYLGTVPGAGRFGFSYVAWVVLGMMVLVGPVDWFVLKMLGRQPWTWVTTSGWIGLITLGALFIGHVFKSGELHYRTVELFDQADDQLVARTTLAGVYSPRTTTYHFDAPSPKSADGKPTVAEPPLGWWDPASMQSGYGRSGMKFDAGFHQSLDGNAPEAVTINVWNLRFMRGETKLQTGPMVVADLHVTSPMLLKQQRITGTIKNVSGKTLTHVRVQVNTGYLAGMGQSVPLRSSQISKMQNGMSEWAGLADAPVLIPSLKPGESVAINAQPPEVIAPPTPETSDVPPYRGYYADTPVVSDDDLWAIATDLSAQRSARSIHEMQRGDQAIIYARISEPEPSVVLREPGAKEKHQAILRALVEVKPTK